MDGQQLFEKILSVVNQSETVVFYCEYQPDWPVLFISENLKNYGYLSEKLYSGELKYHQIVHNEDLDGLHQAVEEVIEQNGQHLYHVLRILTPDQTEVEVELKMTFERDASGVVTHILGEFFDITHKVKAERQNRFLAKVVEQTADLVKVTDPDGKLIYVNDALSETTGYSREELIGRKASILKAELSDHRKSKKLWDTINAGNVYKNMIRNRCKDGSIYYEAMTISPIWDDAGNIEYFVSTGKDLTEQVEAKESSADASMQDPLTGFHNQNYLLRVLFTEMDRANRYGQRFSLLMFNIDFFKSINDKHGNFVGDEVIIEIAKRVHRVMRASDYFGRWGEEKFMAIGLEMDLNATLALAEKIREVVEDKPFPVAGKVTVSVGATVYYRNETEDDILKRVDEALYLAKNNGRNRVEIT